MKGFISIVRVPGHHEEAENQDGQLVKCSQVIAGKRYLQIALREAPDSGSVEADRVSAPISGRWVYYRAEKVFPDMVFISFFSFSGRARFSTLRKSEVLALMRVWM